MIETVFEYLGNVFILAGIFFLFVGSIGLLRLPDFYTRLHGTSKTDSLGIGLVFLGLLCYSSWGLVAVKLILIIFFVFFTGPVSSHALAKAAYKGGLVPYQLNKKTGSDTPSHD